MTDATIINGPWIRAIAPEREPRPHFGMKKLGEMAAACGDAFDLAHTTKSVDRGLVLDLAAKLDAHAQQARLLAEEARLLRKPLLQWELRSEADKWETRSAELQAEETQ